MISKDEGINLAAGRIKRAWGKDGRMRGAKGSGFMVLAKGVRKRGHEKIRIWE